MPEGVDRGNGLFLGREWAEEKVDVQSNQEAWVPGYGIPGYSTENEVIFF